MYGITSLISFVIRQFFLPNPFINMFENAEIINLICGGIFIPLAYLLTGTWYVSRKGLYFVGSIGFLINYILITFLLIGISSFISNIWLVFILFMAIYIILCIIESKLLSEKIITYV